MTIKPTSIDYYFVPFRLTKDEFSGPGWDTLKQEIEQTHFLLLGEEPHRVAQIPSFVDALSLVFRPKAFIAEISPYEAQDLDQLALETALPLDCQKRYSFALSSYSWTQEFRLACIYWVALKAFIGPI